MASLSPLCVQGLAALSGTCVGLYMALEFFPQQVVLQVRWLLSELS